MPRERRIYFAGKKAITRLRSLARESEVKKGPEWLRDGNGGGTLDEARLQLFTDDDSKRNYGDTNQLNAVENAPQWQAAASPSPFLRRTKRTALRTQRHHHAFQLRRCGAKSERLCKGHKSGTQVGIRAEEGNGRTDGTDGTHSKFGFTILFGRGKTAGAGGSGEGTRESLKNCMRRWRLPSFASLPLPERALYNARRRAEAAKSPNFDSFHKTIIFSRGAQLESSGNERTREGFPVINLMNLFHLK